MAAVIHVDATPEPASFDKQVRQKGLAWLKKQKISLNRKAPAGTKFQTFWRSCLDHLYQQHDGICSYLAVHFERVTGAGSVDHFIAKSQKAGMAYEWTNFRLACSAMNSAKNVYDDVLDPFEVKDRWFHLNLVTGEISANRRIKLTTKVEVNSTIARLGLNEPAICEMRARHYQEYCQGRYDDVFLKSRSPFVWMEAQRQGLL